jgi:hypothetical protein
MRRSTTTASEKAARLLEIPYSKMRSSAHRYEHGEAQATHLGSRSRGICALSSMSVGNAAFAVDFGLNSMVTMNRSLARPPDLPVELANLIEVRAHAGAGKFRIMRLDRLEDREMRIEGEPVLTGIA